MSSDISFIHASDGSTVAADFKSIVEKRRFSARTLQVDQVDAWTTVTFAPEEVVAVLVTRALTKCLKDLKESGLHHAGTNPTRCVVIYYELKQAKSTVVPQLASCINNISEWTEIEIEDVKKDSKAAITKLITLLVELSEPSLPGLAQFKLFPPVVTHGDDVCILFLKGIEPGEGINASETTGNAPLTLTSLSSTAYTFCTRHLKPGENRIHVMTKKTDLGTSGLEIRSRLDKVDSILSDVNNPLEFICEALHILSSHEQLDSEMCDILNNDKKHIFKELFERYEDQACRETSKRQIPTLLHFAAKHGLKDFSEKLMSLPGGKTANKTRNKDGQLPWEIAQDAGFEEMVETLKHPQGRKMVSPFGLSKSFTQADRPTKLTSKDSKQRTLSLDHDVDMHESPPSPQQLSRSVPSPTNHRESKDSGIRTSGDSSESDGADIPAAYSWKQRPTRMTDRLKSKEQPWSSSWKRPEHQYDALNCDNTPNSKDISKSTKF